MSAIAESEVQGGRWLGRCKGLLEVMSFEVPAESVRTVAAAQSWKQRKHADSIPSWIWCYGRKR